MQWPAFIKWPLKQVILCFVANEVCWRLYKKICVFPVEKVVAIRGQWLSRQLENKLRQEKLLVLSGPFQGMKYPEFRAAGSAIIPKLLGTYECELAEVIEDYARRELPLVVDIGCAEGYYAVGMALKLPKAKVLAYDISIEAQAFCREMAQINEVGDRVVIRGECGPEDLRQQDFSRGGLIICDCEGYEADLFDSDLAQDLRQADLLIELHDGKRPGATGAIEKAFAKTHDIRIMQSMDDNRKVRLYQSRLVSTTDRFERLQAFTERRWEVMEWAILTPKKSEGKAA